MTSIFDCFGRRNIKPLVSETVPILQESVVQELKLKEPELTAADLRKLRVIEQYGDAYAKRYQNINMLYTAYDWKAAEYKGYIKFSDIIACAEYLPRDMIYTEIISMLVLNIYISDVDIDQVLRSVPLALTLTEHKNHIYNLILRCGRCRRYKLIQDILDIGVNHRYDVSELLIELSDPPPNIVDRIFDELHTGVPILIRNKYTHPKYTGIIVKLFTISNYDMNERIDVCKILFDKSMFSLLISVADIWFPNNSGVLDMVLRDVMFISVAAYIYKSSEHRTQLLRNDYNTLLNSVDVVDCRHKKLSIMLSILTADAQALPPQEVASG